MTLPLFNTLATSSLALIAPAGLELHLVAGDATEPHSVMSINSNSGDVDIFSTGVGDKTVLRSSALLDERVGGEWKPTVQTLIDWTSVLFLPAVPRKNTSDPVFEDNKLYWLLEYPQTHNMAKAQE